MSLVLDFKKFNKGITQMTRNVDKELREKAMFQAGNELLRDAIRVIPKAPFDEGHLRASARTSKPKVGGGKAEIAAGFNIVYAARWHELTPAEDARINWTLPGSGRKYLETKLWMFKDKYMAIIGKVLGRAINPKSSMMLGGR